jgi:hypothetical protein
LWWLSWLLLPVFVFYTENSHKSNADVSNHDNTHIYTRVHIGTFSPPSAGGGGG